MSKELVIWYDSPAADDEWETKSLPIGNGYMGASIFGGAYFEGKHREKLTLSEKSFWSGGPSPHYGYNGGNRSEDSYLSAMAAREALLSGDTAAAEELCSKLTGGSDGYGAFATLGNLYFTFEGLDNITDYKRKLLLKNGTASVCFKNNGEYHRREYFASHPAGVIAAKFITEGGSHSFTVSMDNAPDGAEFFCFDGEFTMSGERPDNGLRYYMTLSVYTDGEITYEPFGVKNSTHTVLYLTAETDYKNSYPDYRSGLRPSDAVRDRLAAVHETRYGAVLLEHQADYSRIMDRAWLDLGAEFPDIPTDCLLECYKNEGDPNTRRCVEELYFRYGRYLLYSSSREGSLPANLQGVWNNTNTPPWGGDYHININLQMNYWPAMVTNMAETMPPLVDFVDGLRAPGRITAAEYHGIRSDAEHPENGWIAHTQSTPFGWTCPGWDFHWGWSSAAAAWLCMNIWQYYEFTRDTDYLRERIYPIMRESAVFYLQWLTYDERQGRIVSSPSYSPEHGPISSGNTYEQSLIAEFLSDFAEAADILRLDGELSERARRTAADMHPFIIGARGQLKEWFEEDTDSFDSSAVEQNHRHLSHLLGLYPGRLISSATPELMRAAVVSLNERGDESTGWARAHKINLWARTGDGNRAYKLLYGMLLHSTLPNLWDTHPPFQIDGNLGGAAGMAEMLLQSHEGFIAPLPALPLAWRESGCFEGLMARGGFEISCRWQDGEITLLRVKSTVGGVCRLRIGDELTEFESEPGREYTVIG